MEDSKKTDNNKEITLTLTSDTPWIRIADYIMLATIIAIFIYLSAKGMYHDTKIIEVCNAIPINKSIFTPLP